MKRSYEPPEVIIDAMTTYHESRIDAVTVHRRGAVVSRLVALSSAALDSLRVGPLPLSIDDASVRVSIDSNCPLHATDLKVVLDAPAPDESLPPARPEDLDAARRATRRLTDALSAVRRDRARIEALPSVARPASKPGVEPPPSPAESRLALLALRDRRLREADERVRQLTVELREAERELADLLDREARATSARRTEPGELRKAVEISLRGGDPDEPAVVRVEYRVDAARWAPTYALRLDRDMGRGAVEVRAMVAQRSGEDWAGVELALSTASLDGWAELPELASIRIGRRQSPPSRSGWRPPPVGTDALFADFDRERELAQAAIMSPRSKRERAAQPHVPDAPPPSPSATSAGAPEPLRAAAMPPPARSPAPRAGRAAPTQPRRRAPMEEDEAVAPAPQAKSMSRTADFGADLSESFDALFEAADAPLAREEQPPAPDAVDLAMLDYGRLRMPAPSATARGKLTLRARREVYVELIEELHVEVDLTAALRLIEQRAAAVDQAALPVGCSPPSVSGFDYVYRADGRLDAPSDGVFHNLSLLSREGDARARFVVVPRESRDAFRFVEMDNPLDTPLLDGPIDVFVGGDFLMTGALAEVPEGGVLRLGLGVEQRIKVSRNARFAEKSGGLMGGKLDLLHDVEIEVDNLLPRSAEIEVRERLPVLREDEDDIRFEMGEVSPRWTEWEPEDQPELEGGRRWQLEIPAGEKRRLRASYSIRIASKHELVGGNRREA